MSGGDDMRFETRHPDVRAFHQPRRPGFADCAPSGRVRLDALACWLQDVAYADVQDAGLEQAAVWVVRRTRIRVNRFPRFGERFAADHVLQRHRAHVGRAPHGHRQRGRRQRRRP